MSPINACAGFLSVDCFDLFPVIVRDVACVIRNSIRIALRDYCARGAPAVLINWRDGISTRSR